MLPLTLLHPMSVVNSAPAKAEAVPNTATSADKASVVARCLQSLLNFCDVAVMRVFIGFFLIRQLAPGLGLRFVLPGVVGEFMGFLCVSFGVWVLSRYS